MECTWKMLLLLALAFLAVQYMAIRKITLNGLCQGVQRCHSRQHRGTLDYYVTVTVNVESFKWNFFFLQNVHYRDGKT